MKKLKHKQFSRKIIFLLAAQFLVLFFASGAIAQANVTGRVLNDSNEVMQAVIITNKNTNKTVVSSNNGEFSIAAKEGDVIEISSVGYITEQLITAAEKNITGWKKNNDLKVADLDAITAKCSSAIKTSEIMWIKFIIT